MGVVRCVQVWDSGCGEVGLGRWMWVLEVVVGRCVWKGRCGEVGVGVSAVRWV